MRKPLLAGLLVLTGALSSFGCRPAEPGLPLLATSNFQSGQADGWAPNDPAHWRVIEAGGSMIYELAAAGEPGPIRAPASVSVWTGHDVSSFEFTGRLRCDADAASPVRDICIIFHYSDPAHFYYVHFAGSSDAVHNIIGIVDGADRVKINTEPAGTTIFRLTDRAWHAFKVTCDARTGDIRAYLDDMTSPVLTARDKRIGHGLVGVGSFDDTGAFDDLALRGIARKD